MQPSAPATVAAKTAPWGRGRWVLHAPSAVAPASRGLGRGFGSSFGSGLGVVWARRILTLASMPTVARTAKTRGMMVKTVLFMSVGFRWFARAVRAVGAGEEAPDRPGSS